MKPGAWRYTFNVDGVTTVDSRNVNVSPSQTQVQSVLYVPGDFSETRNVPHGAVSTIRYVASALGNARREMYVYTPPGYDKGTASYPVLYLIHGGGDTAISWSTVGRANDILDNLLAEKKARPMIVVMPSGWTPSGGQVMTSDATKDPFNDEMLKDIIPFVQANQRAVATPESRALSGLSMGGIQTLNTGLHNLGTFRYVAVMSSGWTTEEDRQFFYKSEAAKIPTYNSQLKLFWWGWGETDIARANGLMVIEKLKSQGVKIETHGNAGRARVGELAVVSPRDCAEVVSLADRGRQRAARQWCGGTAPLAARRKPRQSMRSLRIRARSVCGLIRSSRAAPWRPSTRPWVARRAASMCRRITVSSGSIGVDGASPHAHRRCARRQRALAQRGATVQRPTLPDQHRAVHHRRHLADVARPAIRGEHADVVVGHRHRLEGRTDPPRVRRSTRRRRGCRSGDRAAAGSRSERPTGDSRGLRETPAPRPCAGRSRCVAATMRTFTCTGRSPPTRTTSPSCTTRSSRTWAAGGSSPTSSRNSVPPSACSNQPFRRLTAPVNAPCSWPNSSESISSGEIAPQFTRRNGPLRNAEWSWMARAMISLPVPVSPNSSTGAPLRDTIRARAITAARPVSPPIIRSSPARALPSMVLRGMAARRDAVSVAYARQTVSS